DGSRPTRSRSDAQGTAVTADVLIVLGGYLLGSIPFGYVLPRLLRGEDVRRHGSGNVGASNVWRAYGPSLGVPVALLGVAKRFVPALVGLEVGGDWVGVLAGAAAMVGHARPVFLRFSKGGKMVATAAGVALLLAPLSGPRASLCGSSCSRRPATRRSRRSSPRSRSPSPASPSTPR